MSRRAVVTGGAGFVGSHLCEALADRGWEVVSVDDLSTGVLSNLERARAKGVTAERMDITDPGLERVMTEAAPQVVFHLAAISSVQLCEKSPRRCGKVNVEGTARVLESAARSGAEKLVNISSLAVHGAAPGSVGASYGLSKLAAEDQVRRQAASAGIDWVTLRPANVYGPRQHGDGESAVVATWFGAIADRRPLFLDGDGLQTRDFLYVADAVEAVIAAAERGSGTAIDVGGGVETSLNSLVRHMREVTGWEGTLGRRPPRPGDIRRSVVDPRSARTVLGWSAGTDLAIGLRRTWEWVTVS